MHRTLRWTVLAVALLAVVVRVAALGPDPAGRAAPQLQPPVIDRPQFMGLNAYYGELHQHTGYSPDGCGLPYDAILSAQSRGNDFMAFTDHHNSFYYPEIGDPRRGCRIEALDHQKWETLLSLADAYNHDGVFVLIRGYEHTRWTGHLNVFNSDHYTSPVDQDDFYAWLAGQPLEVYAQINHPLPFDWGGMGDLEDFRAFPPAAPKIRLFEMAISPPFHEFYSRAISKGWPVSAVGYGDGHDAVLAGTRRYGILAEDITRATLNDALRHGRTFGNTDGRLAVGLYYTATVTGAEPMNDDGAAGAWMGTPTSAEGLVLHAYAADWSDHQIVRIELVGRQGIIDACEPLANPAECTFIVEDVAPRDFFYLHVEDANGDHGWSGSIIRPEYPRLQTNPATLGFAVDTASQASVLEQPFLLESNDGADGHWQITPLVDWLQVSPTQGQELPATITVSASGDALATGLHTGALAIEGVDHLSTVVGAQVQVDTNERPSLRGEPRILTLATPLQSPVITGTIQIEAAPAECQWFASSTVPWLTLPSESGSGSGPLTFTVDLHGYPEREHVGHVVLMAGSAIWVTEVRCSLQPYNPQLVTMQRGVNGYEAVSDTYIDEWYPETVLGDDQRLYVRSGGTKTALLRFDLAEIPATARVFSATLNLYAWTKSTESSLLLRAHELLAPWAEAEATWFQAAEGQLWATAGAVSAEDMAPQPVVELGATSTRRWYALDITQLVQKWVAEPATNHGVAIRGEASTSMGFQFRSSETVDDQADLRPKLAIVYGEPPPTPTPTASPTPSPTMTATPTPTTTATPSPTASATATATPSPTASPTTIRAGQLYLPLAVRP